MIKEVNVKNKKTYRSSLKMNPWLLLVLATIVVSIAIKWLIDFVDRCRKLPPGPWGLPLVGYAPWIGKRPQETFVHLAKKYGKIFSVRLGLNTVVVLNDWVSIKEALVNQGKTFSGRPPMFLWNVFVNKQDISTRGDHIWKKQRMLSLQCLRDIGMGKKSMESRAMDIVHDVFEELNQADGKVIPVFDLFFGPILKSNWKLASGDEADKSIDLKEIKDLIFSNFEAIGFDNIVNTFPWLRFLPPNGFGFWEYVRKNETLVSYLTKVVEDHKKNRNEGDLNDFIDHYLAENHRQQLKNGTIEAPYNTDHLIFTTWNIFMGGVDTTNGTTLWGLLHLALNPSIQNKAQNELDEVVGRHRLPNINDMPQLPYIEALVMEVHRVASLVPLSVPLSTVETTQLLGHTIPKGTTVLQNIYAVHNDPELWDRPEVFNPERFITENNKAKAPPYLIPFSVGPRLCIGMNLAEMELKLLFACLLHQFTFDLPPGQPLPSLEPGVGLTVKPLPYSLFIRKKTD